VTGNTGLYVHVPFCREKCHYCSFYSEPSTLTDERIGSYIKRSIEEVEYTSSIYGSPEIDTVYFGGGTPSMLGEAISPILDSIYKNYSVDHDAEITLEMNPHDVDGSLLKRYRDMGVNRLSLGVQTLNPDFHRNIGRTGRPCSTTDLDLYFLAEGFKRSVDIMAGLPGQSEDDLLHDLSQLLSYRPEHVSLYLLSLESGTLLEKRVTVDDIFEQNQVLLWDRAIDYLKSKGFFHYEVSNFALPGFESRHNMKYWRYEPYIGIGPGAHSFVSNRRYSLSPDLHDYLEIEAFNYIYDERDFDDEVVEFVMTGLRCLKGFNPHDFKKKTGRNLPADVLSNLDLIVNQGNLKKKCEIYSLTTSGLKILNELTYEILKDHL